MSSDLQDQLDVMVISSSRPKLLPYLVDSFRKYIFYHGKFRPMLHEDFVFPKESNKVLKYAEESSFFDEIHHHQPKVGIGEAINFLLPKIQTKYVFNMQDDGEFELPVDVSHILGVMDRNPHINGIFFNKRYNLEVINDYKFDEERYDNLFLCLANQWPLFNGIWRTDFIKKNWNTNTGRRTQEAHGNLTIKGGQGSVSKEYGRNNVGGYIYGPLKYPRVIRHLGGTWSMKSKGNGCVKSDGPGGNVKYDLTGQASLQRAPGLPQEEERPLYLDNKQDQVKQLNKDGK